MKNVTKLALAGLLACGSMAASAFESDELVGTWCLYEKESAGKLESQQVNLTFNEDGTYDWMDTLTKKSGTWSVDEHNLILSDIGVQKVISVSDHRAVFMNDSTLKLRKESCF
ncbi:hypothetical protein MAH1_24370 [Sessilibacter sp. MAH1]